MMIIMINIRIYCMSINGCLVTIEVLTTDFCAKIICLAKRAKMSSISLHCNTKTTCDPMIRMFLSKSPSHLVRLTFLTNIPCIDMISNLNGLRHSLRADSTDSLKRSEVRPHFSSGNQLSLHAGYLRHG